MTPDVNAVKAFIVSCLREPLSAAGMSTDSVPDDIDLRTRGVIDSLGFIQLLGELEARFGCAIDLSDLAPEQLTNLGMLSRHIATRLASRTSETTPGRDRAARLTAF